jgi:hypothetical protein
MMQYSSIDDRHEVNLTRASKAVANEAMESDFRIDDMPVSSTESRPGTTVVVPIFNRQRPTREMFLPTEIHTTHIQIAHLEVSENSAVDSAVGDSFLLLQDVLRDGFECGIINERRNSRFAVEILQAGAFGLAAVFTGQMLSLAEIMTVLYRCHSI